MQLSFQIIFNPTIDSQRSAVGGFKEEEKRTKYSSYIYNDRDTRYFARNKLILIVHILNKLRILIYNIRSIHSENSINCKKKLFF